MQVSAAKNRTHIISPVLFSKEKMVAKSFPNEITNHKIQNIQQQHQKTADELALQAKKWIAKSEDFAKCIKKYGKKTLSQTIDSCEKIWELKNDLRLTTHQLFKLALFIETKFKEEIKKGHFYLGRGSNGLDRSVEYDPKSKRTFIHLATALGSGTHKVVTKSLMYDHEHPELVANASTSEDITREVKVHKKFKHMNGLAHTYAVTQHVNRKIKKKMTSIILKLYNSHSLSHYLYHRNELSEKEELIIARDLLYGLENMHKKNLVHRDMHPGNFLINREINQKTKKETISAVIIDFGRTVPKDQGGIKSPWMPTKQINAPETFAHHPKNINYKATDIYALGYQLYHLHCGKPPKVPSKEEFAHAMRGINVSRHNFKKSLSDKITKIRGKLKKEVEGKEKNHKAKPHDLFKKVIAQMCNTNPKARGTAHELRKKIERLIEKM